MGMKLLSIGFLLAFSGRIYAADDKPLDFQEVFNLVRTNISDISEAELRHNAALGFIKEMGTRVQLVRTNAEPAAQPADAITRRSVFEDHFGYIRIRSVDERLPSDFHKSLAQLIQSNALKGIILDLRYAEGTNYEAAAEIADRFIPAGQRLLRLDEKQITSSDQAPAVRLPLAVLVNGETRAAAEAAAAMLKELASGLLIGKKTMGEARLFEVFTLSTGQKLRVAKVPIEVGRGKVIPASGIEPDITIAVDTGEEKLFYQDSYRERPPTTRAAAAQGSTEGTTASRARRLNEAELVRRHREGFDFSEDDPAAAVEGNIVTDPALSRAIDFLKGVSKVVARPPL
jgi:C-terminal processing protease CtpA/Prc